MSLQGMNHFTVLSDNLEETRKFYCDLLGFEEGPRPNFRFPGYWLYVGDQPILHVIHRDQLNEVRAGVIDHMAFTATDLPGTVAKLEKAGVQYELRRLPQGGVRERPVAAVLRRPAWRQGRVRFRQGRAGAGGLRWLGPHPSDTAVAPQGGRRRRAAAPVPSALPPRA